MKAGAILVILILMLPLVQAEMPEEVEDFCKDLDMDDCNNYSYWFDYDGCSPQIRCNVLVDLDGNFTFRGCQTLLRFVMDDCEKDPSPLCFNGVAYDISKSETCTCGGVRFKEIDSCGNPLEWGECIDLDSCTDVTKIPHTGAAIVVKEECDIVEQDCDGATEHVGNMWMVTMDEPSVQEEEEDEIEVEEEPGIPEPVIVQEPVETQPTTPEEVIVEDTTAPKVTVEAKESKLQLVVMILMGVVALLFLIVLISWVYVSYFKK